MNKVKRTYLKQQVLSALDDNPIVMLLGVRQSGKTTLAREILSDEKEQGKPVHYYDLEYPPDAEALKNPTLALESLQGIVVIDECQRMPTLFPLLRVLADRQESSTRFLLLGSASGKLLQQGSESLAGRVKTIYVQGFGIHEVKAEERDRLWLRGGLPRSFLGDSDEKSFERREDFLKTFLSRDLPDLGSGVSTAQLFRFWQMAAHYHGQVWNSSEISRSLGITQKTINHYLDLLTDAMVVRQLIPYHTNVAKRIVKAPKFYVRDSGLFHTLLNIRDRDSLVRHPKLGASWEGFALEQVLHFYNESPHVFFFSIHAGAEIDLLAETRSGLQGFEFKYADAPKLTKSIVSVFELLNLSKLFVVYPGKRAYPLSENVEVVPLMELWSRLEKL